MKKLKKVPDIKKLSPYKMYFFITAICVALSWFLIFHNLSVEADKYKELLKKADILYERKIYDESLEAYLNCLKVNSEEKTALDRVCTIYMKDRKYDRAINYADELIKYYPDEPEGYIKKAKAYEGKDQYGKAVSVLKDHRKMKKVKEYYDKILGLFDLDYINVSEPGIWVECDGGRQFSQAKKGKNPCLCGSNGKTIVTGPYKYIGYPSDGETVIPVKEGDECFYVDRKGKRRIVPEESFEWTGTFSEGLASARQGDVFGYIDRNMKKKNFEYSEAYPFFEGKAVVKKDDRYFEINKEFEKTAEYGFEKVKASRSGRVCNYGVIIGAVGDKEYLYSSNGKRISEGMDEILLPKDKEGPMAFREGKKWGFINKDGSVFMGPAFDGAGSFSEGMAPVKQEGKWGYISNEGKLIIPCQFDYAGPLSNEGTSWVRNHTGWSLLRLKCYEKED